MEYTKVKKTRMDPAKEAEVLSTNKRLRWIRSYLGKVRSIQDLDRVFREAAKRPLPDSQFGSMTGVRLRIYVSPDYGYVDEELEIVFDGGELIHRGANGNGTDANLREIAKLANGGYYTEEEAFDEMNAEWWELMFDENGAPSLWVPEIIGKPAWKNDEDDE